MWNRFMILLGFRDQDFNPKLPSGECNRVIERGDDGWITCGTLTNHRRPGEGYICTRHWVDPSPKKPVGHVVDVWA
jgi:hypothetical protein